MRPDPSPLAHRPRCRLARRELRTLLAEFQDVEVVGEADDVASACEPVDLPRRGLPLLDIQMPGGTGFEACGHYAQAWFDGKRPLVARTLAQREDRLDDGVFFRASLSHLVNLRWIEAIAPWVDDGHRITLRDGHVVEVSRRQAKVLREKLEC